MKRIRRLLHEAASRAWIPLLVVAPILGTGLIALDMSPPLTAERSTLPRQRQTIIDDKERDAFQKLTTDEEREMFIGQFWDRCNPNPGSPENEFRRIFPPDCLGQ